MPAPRTPVAEQLDLALDDLVRLGSRLPQLDIVASGGDRVAFHPHDGEDAWPAKVLAFEAVGEAQARKLLATEARGRKVVVANRISEPARRLLAEARWSWLDRRIGAHLATPRRDIDVLGPLDGPAGAGPRLRPPSLAPEGPIRGRAGLAYAAALLLDPGRPPSLRSVASAIGMSPTAVGNARQHLVDAGLIGPGGEPTLPDLFWTLAQVWAPLKAVPVATTPEPGRDRKDWVLGGDQAALALGAPVFSTDARPWLWVPTQVALRRAERRYGAASWDERAAVVAVPPTPLVNQRAQPPGDEGWPLVHPVFAALELAGDDGRGREILGRWDPEGATPVWR